MKKFLEQLIAVSPMLRSVCLKAKHCHLIIQNNVFIHPTVFWGGGGGGGGEVVLWKMKAFHQWEKE